MKFDDPSSVPWLSARDLTGRVRSATRSSCFLWRQRSLLPSSLASDLIDLAHRRRFRISRFCRRVWPNE